MQSERPSKRGENYLPSESSASLTSRMSNKGSTRLGKNPTVAGEWGVLQIVQEFVDKRISGAIGREQGSSDALWKRAIRKEFV